MSVHRDILAAVASILDTAGAGRVLTYTPFIDNAAGVDVMLAMDGVLQCAIVTRSDVDAVEAVPGGAGHPVVFRGRRYQYTIDLFRALSHAGTDISEHRLGDIHESCFEALSSDTAVAGYAHIGGSVRDRDHRDRDPLVLRPPLQLRHHHP